MAAPAIAVPRPVTRTPLNSNQIKGFWAAWGGWCLDGMDAFIYSLVLVPALTELLPKSGIPATPGNIGYYGSILFALFLAGWGMSMVWGPIADRFGRVKALMMTILMYSFFTFACGLAQNVWQLAVLRVFCGIGLGGEQPIGGTFIAEEWPEDRRKMGAGYMHTGYYFGFFLAALANYVIGTNFGWRWMFMLGGTPALLVGWIQSGVHESAGWKAKFENPAARPRMRDSFAALFSARFSKRTITTLLDRAGFDIVRIQKSGAGKYISVGFFIDRMRRFGRIPYLLALPLSPFRRRFVYVNPWDELIVIARPRPSSA